MFFGPLFEPVEKFAKRGYPTPETLRSRLTSLLENWQPIMTDVQRTLRTRAAIEEELQQAGCPLRFSDLGVGRDRARRAIVHSKDIRNRYTILHLASELGMLEQWADEALQLLY